MKQEIEKVIGKLAKYITSENEIDEDEFEEFLYEISDELDEIETNFDAIEPLLNIIEKNPDLEYGGPGPLGHFMEKHYKKGYEELLLLSIEREPTIYTLQLLHRLINDKNNPNQQKFLEAMKNVSLNKEYSKEIIDEAKDSLRYFK